MSAIGQPAEGQAPPENAGGEEQTTTTAPETGQPGGLDRLYERMDEMAGAQRQLLASLQSLAPEEEAEEQYDPADFYTPDGDLTEDGARALIQDLVSEQVEARLAPREAARLVQERDEAYEALKEDHPDLQDGKTAQRVLGRAVQWAQAHDPSLIDRPEFVDVIEAFFKADKFDELRQAEQASQPRGVVLESAQGARHQQQQPQIDWGDRIAKAAERLRPSI